jgi:acetoin utilization protein AcuB
MTTQSAPPRTHSSIERFMTPNPHCIGRDQSLAVAHERMRSLGVRHLPVLDAGKLVGILSQRDLLFVETLHDVEPSRIKVEEAMSVDVYSVPPERPVGEVASMMVEHKYGSAVVMKGEKVVGVFTTMDALRTLMSIVDAWL